MIYEFPNGLDFFKFYPIVWVYCTFLNKNNSDTLSNNFNISMLADFHPPLSKGMGIWKGNTKLSL